MKAFKTSASSKSGTSFHEFFLLIELDAPPCLQWHTVTHRYSATMNSHAVTLTAAA